MRIAWRVDYQAIGPEHDKSYTATLTLQSPLTGDEFPFVSRSAPTQKEAALQVAAPVSRMIALANSSSDWIAANQTSVGEARGRLAEFLLRHEFVAVPVDFRRARRWLRFGLLGSQLLASGKHEAFLTWANTVEALFRSGAENLPDLQRCLAFYRLLPGDSEATVQRWRHEVISAAKRLVERLNPEEKQPDVRTTVEFTEIVSLSKLAQLFSKQLQETSLADVVDGFLLLRSLRQYVRLEGTLPQLSLMEKEGAYHQLLIEAVSFLVAEASLQPGQSIAISFGQVGLEANLVIEFVLPFKLRSTDLLSHRMETGWAWRLLTKLTRVSSVDIHEQGLRVCCRRNAYGGSFGERALMTYGDKDAPSIPENELLSRLLHDFKNQLVAYQMALDSGGGSRESSLRARYDATRHLNAATGQVHSLETLGKAMSAPQIEYFDLRLFLREYVADKMTSVPANIRVEPPKTLDPCKFWNAPVFLRAILDNLFNNSVYAMPDGGEIRLDWVFDPHEEALRLELSDTGPGIPSDLQRFILEGKAIHSSKHQGSGIGLVTVRSMLQRLGGKLDLASSSSAGTRWIITIPSQAEVSEDRSEDMEQTFYELRVENTGDAKSDESNLVG